MPAALVTLAKAELLPDAPTSDMEAWMAYPSLRWVWDKSAVATLQGVRCGLMPMPPPQYPVVLRPLTNMYGMGWQAYVLHSEDDFAAHWGHTGVWTPLLRGTHWSVDAVVEDGRIAWWTAFEGRPARLFGVFDAWHWRHQPAALAAALATFRQRFLPRLAGFRGCLNLEAIGDTIIEVHLRPGDVGMLAADDATLLGALRAPRWPLGPAYRPASRVRCLLPVWWPGPLPWPLAPEAVRSIVSGCAVCTECPGAVVSGLKRCALLVAPSAKAAHHDRQQLLRRATAAALAA